jgi:DNA-binding PucR family transcriptional regulator
VLVDRVHRTLSHPRHAALLSTTEQYLEHGGSLEATARALYVHPNTVRYRLGRIAAVTGYDLTAPREAWAARIGLVLGGLGAPGSSSARIVRQ